MSTAQFYRAALLPQATTLPDTRHRPTLNHQPRKLSGSTLHYKRPSVFLPNHEEYGVERLGGVAGKRDFDRPAGCGIEMERPHREFFPFGQGLKLGFFRRTFGLCVAGARSSGGMSRFKAMKISGHCDIAECRDDH